MNIYYDVLLKFQFTKTSSRLGICSADSHNKENTVIGVSLTVANV